MGHCTPLPSNGNMSSTLPSNSSWQQDIRAICAAGYTTRYLPMVLQPHCEISYLVVVWYIEGGHKAIVTDSDTFVGGENLQVVVEEG